MKHTNSTLKRLLSLSLASLLSLSSLSCTLVLKEDVPSPNGAVSDEEHSIAHGEQFPSHNRPSEETVVEWDTEALHSSHLNYTLLDDGTYQVSGPGESVGETLVIPSSHKGIPVTAIGELAFAYESRFSTVIIPDSVTGIGSSAFRDCTSLTSVTIPDSVTGIGNYAFRGCTSLTSVTLPDSVTSIGIYAFRDCSSLTSVTIPDSVTGIGNWAFSNCSSLTSVTIPDSVTGIGDYAFWSCINLTDIYFTGTEDEWNAVSKGTDWDYKTPAFDLYFGQEDDHIHAYGEWGILADPTCTGEGLQARYCECGDEQTQPLPATGHFYETTTNPSADSATIEVDYFCHACGDSYRETIIPESLEITANNRHLVGYTGEYGEELVIPSLILDGDTWYRVTAIGSKAFRDCTSLRSVTLPDSMTEIGRNAFQNCSALISVSIPDSVTNIGVCAFQNCIILTSVNIPSGVTAIRDYTFDGCDALKSVSIPDSVTSISSNAFQNCTSLTKVIVSEDNPEYCSIDGVLYNKSVSQLIFCPRGKSTVFIPSSITSINIPMFMDCTILTAFIVSEDHPMYSSIDGVLYNKSGSVLVRCPTRQTSITIPDSVTSIGYYAFSGCTSLTSITIPDSVISIGDSAFSDCTSLASVSIPDSVTSISYYAFSGCTSLTSVTIPDSVTRIGNYAFEDCTSLTSVTIPDSVTSIGYRAFVGCSSLTSVTIPNSVTSIGSSAFWYCKNLTDIYFTGTEDEWNAVSKGTDWDFATPAYTVHYNHIPD